MPENVIYLFNTNIFSIYFIYIIMTYTEENIDNSTDEHLVMEFNR